MSVLGGACRFPSQPLSAAAGSSACSARARGGAPSAALSESMARAVFEPRPLGALASLRRPGCAS